MTAPRAGRLHGELTLRALLRRRFALAVLVALPLVFYVATHDAVGRSVRALVFGLSWALGTVAFFSTLSARELEPRLALAGWAPRRLVLARVAALEVLGLALAAAFLVVVALDQPVRSVPAVGLDFAVTATVAVAFGTALGTVITKELQGTLVLFFVAGLQAVVNPFDRITALLPFWSSRELGTFAIDGPDQGSLAAGLGHAAVVVAVCAVIVGFGLRQAPQVDRS